jgi:ABC-2 type transport system ATP-binding protein
VTPGQILGYIGPNGAGKTTTVKILIGMLSDFEGTAEVCGFDVATHSIDVKKRIGYVPEASAMYDTLTAFEFLQFVGRIHGLSDKLIDIRSFKMLRLFGLKTEINNRLSTFSRGMRQKVLIISGLIHDPEVIFLDEPLSGLDANSTVIIKELISQLAARGKTIFYCSHMMDVVERVCHRIIIINEGEIIADGSFEELQSMDRSVSLEKIFTQLTSDSSQNMIASQLIAAMNTDLSSDE